jgi:hypothetical protein
MVIASALHEAIPAWDDEIASQRALAKTDIAAVFGIAEFSCAGVGAMLQFS